MHKKTEEAIAIEEFLQNPYEYYYDRYKDEEEFELGIDDYEDMPYDPVAFQEHIDDQIKLAKKERNNWIPKAMLKDPAFMTDPINDYYLKLIPDEVKEDLSQNELLEILEIFDPITWAERNLLKRHGGFKSRNSKKGIPYQSQMIRSVSKKIAARAGRRTGKSISLVVRLMHKAWTWTSDSKPTFNIVIFTPNQSQIDMLFKMIEMLIDENPKLLEMIPGKRIPTRKNPYHLLELSNGVSFKGFVSGSTAIRGQSADILVLDEASFLTEEDTDSVVALLAESKDVELWVSSTPKGLKDYFYDRCYDKDFVSFYFPTNKFHPDWSYEMEQDFRKQLSNAGYSHEVEASFSADGEGVFQHDFVDASIEEYSYAGLQRNENWNYAIGVDWNDPENGTQIYVLGYNPNYAEEGVKPYKLVDKEVVSIIGHTQTTAVRKIRDMNRKWRADIIYVDAGHGAMQVETLHEWGAKAPPNSVDKRLIRTKRVNFSSTVDVIDPWNKKKYKKRMKPHMVNLAVRVFEEFNISIPKEDSILEKQLLGYKIDRINPSGDPVYAKDPKVGDHALDALMVAILGFNMEYSSLHKHTYATKSMASTNIFKKQNYSNISNAQSESDIRLAKDKRQEAEELANARGSSMSINNTVVSRRQKPVRRNASQWRTSSRSKF